MAFTPAKAQTETLTREQREELLTKLMPAVFDQVKMLTGIDILGMSQLSSLGDLPFDLKTGNVFKLIESNAGTDKYTYAVDAGQLIQDLLASDSDQNIGDYNIILDLTVDKNVKVSAIEKTEGDPVVFGDITLVMKSSDFEYPSMANADYVYLNVYGESDDAGSSMIDLTDTKDAKVVKAKHLAKGLNEEAWTPVYATTVELSNAFDLYTVGQPEVWSIMYALFQLGYDATPAALTVTEKRTPQGGAKVWPKK